jgi:hypothetical protein
VRRSRRRRPGGERGEKVLEEPEHCEAAWCFRVWGKTGIDGGCDSAAVSSLKLDLSRYLGQRFEQQTRAHWICTQIFTKLRHFWWDKVVFLFEHHVLLIFQYLKILFYISKNHNIYFMNTYMF